MCIRTQKEAEHTYITYCDVASESRIIRRQSLDKGLLTTTAEQRSVNKQKY
jgi:hypothetical protein